MNVYESPFFSHGLPVYKLITSSMYSYIDLYDYLSRVINEDKNGIR